MGRTKNTETTGETKAVIYNTNDSVPKEKFDELASKYEKLESMLSELMENVNNKPAVTANIKNSPNRMDMACTLIHLRECDPTLPTNMTVNGTEYYFTSFGERKLFRWSDMSNIISKYRTWFKRGYIALGADCEAFRNEIPDDIKTINLPDDVFNRIADLDNDKFERILDAFTPEQKVQIAASWRMKYLRNIPSYKNITKIKILNKVTDGSLKDILTELAED